MNRAQIDDNSAIADLALDLLKDKFDSVVILCSKSNGDRDTYSFAFRRGDYNACVGLALRFANDKFGR